MIPKITNRNTMRKIGLVALALGSTSHALLQRLAPAAMDLWDGVWGMLLGIAIGCLLLSLQSWRRPC